MVLNSSHPFLVKKLKCQITPDKTLDCLGLYCPEPVFRTRQEIDELELNQVLEVIADDPASEEDIPRLIKNIGQEVACLTSENDEFHFLIKKIKQ